jgi:hypothetical protein
MIVCAGNLWFSHRREGVGDPRKISVVAWAGWDGFPNTGKKRNKTPRKEPRIKRLRKTSFPAEAEYDTRL